ncbi:MAG: phage terminase large subunit family protein [Xanthomonadaceae bacterium]|nr:phage terminase large subunit family protein [Xanthomonadaceae bacterium]
MIALSDCDNASAARWEPAVAPRSMERFARTLRLPDGPQAGDPYDPDTEPVQRAFIDVWDSGRFTWLEQIASRQRGKTLTGMILPLLWSAVEHRRSVGVILPNLDKLNQNYEGKYKPAFDNSGYGPWFPTKGPGSRGGRPAAIALRDPATSRVSARVYFMALGKGASETAVSSVSPGTVLVDEADDAENAGQLANACGRIDGWGPQGRAVIVTTLNQRGDRIGHPALQFYIEGTRSRWGHACRHCGACAPIEFEHINLAEGRVACPACSVLWSEDDRLHAIKGGRFIHGTETPSRPGFFSVICWELDFLRGSLSGLINEYRAALAAKDAGDPSVYTVFVNKRLCREDTQSDGEIPTTIDMALAARAAKAPFARKVVPPGAAVITVGGDTGKREAWALQLAMMPDASWYIADWTVRTTGDHRAEPTPEHQWQMLGNLRERITAMGRAHAMGVDVRYNTDLVQRWAKSAGFHLMVGDNRPSGKKDEVRNAALPSWAEDRTQDDGSHWLFIDTNVVKAEIHKALAREPGSAGSGNIPAGQEAGDWLIRHLTSEAWDTKHRVWVKKPGRDNHLLDCLVYAWALAMIYLHRLTPRRRGGVVGHIKHKE